MTPEEVNARYFNWLYDTVCSGRFADGISYRKLFRQLHQIVFIWSFSKDSNRAADGRALRHRFCLTLGRSDLEKHISGPCTVLEMLVALAIRCEEDIMDDPQIGNRTGQWFWRMVTNLGLGAMDDNRYSEQKVDTAVNRFLDRQYSHDGEGGLFTVRGCKRNMRKAEIWVQMLWYLDTIT